MRLKSLLFTIFTLCVMSAQAQDIVGRWTGTLNIPQMEMEIEMVFEFERTNDGLSATLYVPMMGEEGVPADKVEFAEKKVTLEVKDLHMMTYTGILKGDTIEGNIEQMGMTLPFNMKRIVAEKAEEPSEASR